MSRIPLIFLMILFMSCIRQQESIIQNKKWRMVKQVISTVDKKGITTQERVKDFNQIDFLYFESDNKLTVVNYGTSTACSFKLKDNVLTFWPEKETQKISEYRILTSTKDSLVLKRTEIWGSDGALKITATLHLAAKKD